jgi:hypothetical protein
MSTGPLRRAIGLAGLLALAPVLLQLAAGSLTPQDAALRGLAVAATVVLLGRLAQRALILQLRRMERRQGDAGADDEGAETQRAHRR